MYKWYSLAQVCIVYLQDVCHLGEFHISQWFKRGWTLQELIAPKSVRFYDRNWRFLGTKQNLLRELVKITRIPAAMLSNVEAPHQYSVAQRMSWAAGRRTKREEDRAYCLMGLFDVQMSINYGEGTRHAFLRLQAKILSISRDDSIFAWNLKLVKVPSEEAVDQYCGLLAPSPDYFQSAGDIEERGPLQESHIVQGNLSLSLPARLNSLGTYEVYLNVWKSRLRVYMAILLTQVPGEDFYVRTLSSHGASLVTAQTPPSKCMQFTVPLSWKNPLPLLYHGFLLGTLGFHDPHIIRHYTISKNPSQDVNRLKLPSGQIGTAGIIILELATQIQAIAHCGFAFIKLGFDSHCSPICFVRFPDENVEVDRLIEKILYTLKVRQLGAHDWVSNPILSDDWISGTPFSDLPLNLYDSRLGSSDLDGSLRFQFSTRYFDLIVSVTKTPDTWHHAYAKQDVWVVHIEAGTPAARRPRVPLRDSDDCCCICS